MIAATAARTSAGIPLVSAVMRAGSSGSDSAPVRSRRCAVSAAVNSISRDRMTS